MSVDFKVYTRFFLPNQVATVARIRGPLHSL